MLVNRIGALARPFRVLYLTRAEGRSATSVGLAMSTQGAAALR